MYHDLPEPDIIAAAIMTKLQTARRSHRWRRYNIETVVYQISARLTENQELITQHQNSCGRFILATNILELTELKPSEILRIYKEQQSTERGFIFIKDPLFFADSLFVKNPERVETMMMLMSRCLTVYNLGQRQLRIALKTQKATVKNQLNKDTQSPTMRKDISMLSGDSLDDCTKLAKDFEFNGFSL